MWKLQNSSFFMDAHMYYFYSLRWIIFIENAGYESFNKCWKEVTLKLYMGLLTFHL